MIMKLNKSNAVRMRKHKLLYHTRHLTAYTDFILRNAVICTKYLISIYNYQNRTKNTKLPTEWNLNMLLKPIPNERYESLKAEAKH